jgi:hypothetical protein
MLFKERESESPRVPSPWSNARRSSGSRNSSNSSKAGTPDIACQSILRKASSTASPNFSPLSRAVQIRNAEAYRDSVGANQKRYDDEQESSPISTPPSQEEDDDEGLDSFFALDSDVDVQRLSSSQQSLASDILTPIDGVGLLASSSTDLVDTQNQSGKRIVPQTKRRQKRVARLAPEPDVLGNLEYKLRILPPTRHRFDKLLTQMQWRVLQGGGECTYEIGVLDDGLCIGICALEMQASISVLSSMAKELCASVRIRKAFEMVTLDGSSQSEGGELKQMTNEEVFDVLKLKKGEDHCDCGVELNSTQEIVSYLPLQAGYHVTIKTEANKYDDPAPGEIVIAIEQDASELLTYEQDDVSSDNESVTDEVGEEFFMEDGQGLTFSLSLDEKATRAGLGFQRKSNALRRPCRYNVKSALAHKTNVKTKEGAVTMTDYAVHSDSIKEDRLVDSSSAPETTNQKDNATNAPEPEKKCVRMIVEASIIRDSDDEGFIDYGSL